ncbi:MAG: DUF1553 domain-containing protein [Bryobacterales bacterium]|nr:DUF1553 domain-containing protein [Bryobacterales bacterium]
MRGRFAVLPILWCCALASPAADFQRDIRPLLAKKCFACHGPDEHARQAKLRLDTFEGATGQDGGFPGIVPGNAARSRVVARITHESRPMPPSGEPLTGREVALVKEWIDAGAVYQRHWAFEKPVRREPAVRDASWPRNPIDGFVLARLEKENLRPSPEADRYTLARRLALDLTGLPPDPTAAEAFVRDTRPDAYERYAESLLASPHFGERWARVWLDLARYADTRGYENDGRRTVWPYRDWVVRALNANIPFDEFTIKQLAGDLLDGATEDDLIATAFHRNTLTNTEGGTDDEEFRDAAVKDRVAVTGQVWMGLTWGCAQCHTHKYDPLSHKEFYQLYAFFNQTEDSDKPDDRPTIKIGEASLPVMKELVPAARLTRIHERGSFLNPGEPVDCGVPQAFHSLPEGAPKNRLGLARWLMSAENPLTARVQVNRYWARLFGAGLVESEEDFGTQGSAPVHPELLDWLATEYVRLGWDTKALLKTIVTSATYRQNSDVTPEAYERDPYNRLLARGARFRLDAELVRDQALAVSGLLSRKMGGPPVMPWQPPGIWQVVYNSETWTTSEGEDRYRRSLYTFMRRSSPYPAMAAFDAPSGETCTIRRIRTNTPLQALAALNDPVSMESAQHLALRALKEGRSPAERLFRFVLARPPSAEETARILALHREAREELRRGGEDAHKLLRYSEVLYAEDRETAVLADARDATVEWRYTESDPGTDWAEAGYNDAAWSSGPGQFGHFEKPADDLKLRTEWKTENLWLRTTFDVPPGGVDKPKFVVRTNSAFEAWINGASVMSNNLGRNAYYEYELPQAALRPGRNALAIKVTRLGERGQIFDTGVVASRKLDFGKVRRKHADRAAWVVVANTLLNLDETVTRR